MTFFHSVTPTSVSHHLLVLAVIGVSATCTQPTATTNVIASVVAEPAIGRMNDLVNVRIVLVNRGSALARIHYAPCLNIVVTAADGSTVGPYTSPTPCDLAEYFLSIAPADSGVIVDTWRMRGERSSGETFTLSPGVYRIALRPTAGVTEIRPATVELVP